MSGRDGVSVYGVAGNCWYYPSRNRHFNPSENGDLVHFESPVAAVPQATITVIALW
jgi:hypothetical protein